ncbi:RSP_7527 family protein [Sinisalibacter aestuarii]|uniref:Uncharacterized protein n=1 Tax=Sinisalibacter aestuarii TaxID=2949426 RepID=A0ABQ5LXC3_9RHOB|nr:hypothetical protein [Sinisalibacter aestuarii]GKY89031.1 hypothetical protein STA1M1_29000 [Sinisalibacter aestuarii]
MARDTFPQTPRRREDGSIDTDFYIRRAHRLRADNARRMAQDGRRAMFKALHLKP